MLSSSTWPPVTVLPSLVKFEAERLIERLGSMVFFFFFGGVTPEVQTVLKREAAVCPTCKSPAALVEYDNVLRLFLIPVWKWSGDNPALKCTSCPFLMPLEKFNHNRREAGKAAGPGDWTSNLQCWSCSAPLESANFKFCPQCGASL